MEEMKWVDEINEEIKNNGSSIAHKKEQWKKRSIYKVPSQLKELSKNAYKPQTISFGPYHHGEENLKAMEVHKHRALIHFLKRSEKPIELLLQCMDQVVQELRDSYVPLDPIWTFDKSKFLQMMILDGCFIMEILRACCEIPNDYDEDDRVFGEYGKRYLMPYIKHDMLILENQIPMIILYILFEVEIGGVEDDHHELLNKKIMELLNIYTVVRLGKCVHVLDIYRKCVILQGPSQLKHISDTKIRKNWPDHMIYRSAIELHEAGIYFKKSKTTSIEDVSFNRGVLRLPALILDDGTEYLFLNLIAFERLHIEVGKVVTMFILFMDTIINSAIDVSILSRSGILINALGSDEDVAKLFKLLSNEIILDHDREFKMIMMMMEINHFCQKSWKRWRADLIRTYFRNPWSIVSLVAAFLLFALTTIQTIYTVRQFYQKPTMPK